MKFALVTGAPGFLGSAIVASLVRSGVTVRSLALPGEKLDNLRGIETEVVHGNVLDPDAMRRAVDGCDTVFHAAAIYETWAPDPSRMYRVNLGGTFHVLDAARRAGVERVVYTASVVAVGRPGHGVRGDEKTPYDAWDIDFPYSRSKLFSMQLALDFAQTGLDVRVVCPGIVVGPGDIRPTPSGAFILAIMKGKAPGYSDGAFAYVDVRDAADLHVRAAERGRAGEVYLAVGHNLDARQFIESVARVGGRRQRLIRIPPAVTLAVISVLERRARATGKAPDLSREPFLYNLKPSNYDNRKSVEELGASYRPWDDTVRDAIEWFRANGMLRRT